MNRITNVEQRAFRVNRVFPAADGLLKLWLHGGPIKSASLSLRSALAGIGCIVSMLIAGWGAPAFGSDDWSVRYRVLDSAGEGMVFSELRPAAGMPPADGGGGPGGWEPPPGYNSRRVAVLALGESTTGEEEALSAVNDAGSRIDEISHGSYAFYGDIFRRYDVAYEPVDCHWFRVHHIVDRLVDAFEADGYQISDYQHVFVLFPDRCGAWESAWSYIGSGRYGATAAREQVSGYKDSFFDTPRIIRSIGHNIGLGAASGVIDCGGDVYRPHGDGCTHIDGRNPNDIMGRASNSFATAAHQFALGWLDPARVVTVGRNGLFHLLPVDAQACGIQALRVPLPGEEGAYLYVEYRHHRGGSTGVGAEELDRRDAVLVTRSEGEGGRLRDLHVDQIALGSFAEGDVEPWEYYVFADGLAVQIYWAQGGVAEVMIKTPGDEHNRDASGAIVWGQPNGFIGPVECTNSDQDCADLGEDGYCGDGITCGAEECDAGGESPICDTDCTFPSCGDGNLNATAGEECDDGNTADGDGCSATCTMGVEVDWTLVPSGSFVLGTSDEASDAPSAHEVNVQTFRLMSAEVTVAQYGACVDARRCTVPRAEEEGNTWDMPGLETHPINGVDWHQALDFCRWVGGRLPTEAEWEFAARGGGQDIAYPWGDETPTCDYAVMNDVAPGCGSGGTGPVCSKPDGNTADGICDMAGNVWEWVYDSYDEGTGEGVGESESVADAETVEDPDEPGDDAEPAPNRVVRGGAWTVGGPSLSTVERGKAPPLHDSSSLGFRCARYGECGNGILDPGEECDDGGPSAACNWDCTISACGDGITNPEAGEVCDDGNTNGCIGDCAPDCRAEVIITGCGDGFTCGSEQCDDGRQTAACDADCTVARCGDGLVNPAAGEYCDDGGESAGCDIDCSPSACGDGVVNAAAGEVCDDGNTNICVGNCAADCAGTVELAGCGDGIVCGDEQCDDGGESATCNADCSSARCGDGLVNAASGEQCDDGGESAQCTATCTISVCGDGQVNGSAGEVCDDGNTDACNGTCGAYCEQTVSLTGCGDGIQCGAEQCDDGNTDPGDGCSDTCTVEAEGSWITIPGGTFEMGSTDWTREQPVHDVAVPKFEMMRTEVTVAQYRECVDAGVCTAPRSGASSGFTWTESSSDTDSHPVNGVRWQQAAEFCAWTGGRLPSEAEWEYAARGGPLGLEYPWGSAVASCDVAVMNAGGGLGCGEGKPSEVCGKPDGKTPGGLCDMGGNVWEWVQDAYHTSYNGAPTDGGAWGEAGSGMGVIRGGSWGSPGYQLRGAYRQNIPPASQSGALGFRCAR